MASTIQTHQYENGLVLLAESMDWLESAAFSLLVPAGSARDPDDLPGLSNCLCDMVQRGCGPRDSRQFVNDLENLGVDDAASVSTAHTMFRGAMPADRLHQALPIYADLVQRPHLPEQQLEAARSVCIQEVLALRDDWPQQVMLRMSEARYGHPYGRPSPGTVEALQSVTLEDIRNHFMAKYVPQGTILSVAGRIDFPRLRDQVGELFEQWRGPALDELRVAGGDRRSAHIEHESHQMHIGIAYENVAYADPQYYQARAAVGVLSDGMSSRLFTQLREQRGLCYAVYATCHTLKQCGSVFCYAGTTTERAQQTVEVFIRELQRLAGGVEPPELSRLQARLKSVLIMQQESSLSRSGSMAADWYYLNRVQTLDELKRIVDNLTCESINAYLAAHPPKDFTVVTLGHDRLELPGGVL